MENDKESIQYIEVKKENEEGVNGRTKLKSGNIQHAGELQRRKDTFCLWVRGFAVRVVGIFLLKLFHKFMKN